MSTLGPTGTTQKPIGGNYYLNVTIINRYGKDVRIITSLPSHTQFLIPVGERYEITSSSSIPQRFFITAFDAATYTAIKIDGKNSVTVVSSVTPVSLVYNVPAGRYCIQNTIVNFYDTQFSRSQLVQ